MNIKIYKATQKDIDKLIQLRFAFLQEEYTQITEEEYAGLKHTLRSYFEGHLVQNTFIAILLEENGETVSTCFLSMNEKPASPSFPNGKTATLLNVFTYPAFRRKGYAGKTVQRIIEEAKEMKIDVIDLLATEAGFPLYLTLGFTTTEHSFMRLVL